MYILRCFFRRAIIIQKNKKTKKRQIKEQKFIKTKNKL